MRAPESESGFTLVELLVALVIFGILSAAGVALLSFSVQSQGMAAERLDRVAEIRRASLLLSSDFGQAAPRLTRDEAGAVRPAFSGNGGDGNVAVTFVRRGWENVEEAQRPSLQKVEYGLVNGSLERRAYSFLDGAARHASMTLLEGVSGLRLRYRDAKGEWRERWDPQQPSELPQAVEMVLEVEGSGTVRQLFLTGTQA